MEAVLEEMDLPPVLTRQRPTLEVYRRELDGFYEDLRTLNEIDPGTAFQKIAAIGARLVEMRAQLWRTGDVKSNQLRSREVDPLVEAVRFQFQVMSRRLSLSSLEWDISRGV